MSNSKIEIHSKEFNKYLYITILALTVLGSFIIGKKVWNKAKGIQTITEQMQSQTSVNFNDYSVLYNELIERVAQKQSHLDFLSEIAVISQENDLLIKHFPNPKLIDKKKYKIAEYEIELEGKYKNMVQWIDAVERQHQMAKIISTSFYLYKDFEKKSKLLRLKVQLRNLIKNEE